MFFCPRMIQPMSNLVGKSIHFLGENHHDKSMGNQPQAGEIGTDIIVAHEIQPAREACNLRVPCYFCRDKTSGQAQFHHVLFFLTWKNEELALRVPMCIWSSLKWEYPQIIIFLDFHQEKHPMDGDWVRGHPQKTPRRSNCISIIFEGSSVMMWSSNIIDLVFMGILNDITLW